MQNPINKEIRHYQEEIFMGLTLRQLICSVIAIGAAVLAYLDVGTGVGAGNRQLGLHRGCRADCRRRVLPLCDLNFEQFLVAVVESVILGSSWRLWKTEYDLSKPKHKRR